MTSVQLREERAGKVKRARSILDKAKAESRDLSSEETQEYEKIIADVDAMKAKIDREEKLATLEVEQSDPVERIAGTLGRRSLAEPAGRAPLASGGRAEEPAPAPEPRAEEPMRPYIYGRGGDFFIDIPSTFVRVNPSRGALQVEAPDTSVVVDSEKGRASLRAKGMSFDLRW